MWHIFIGYFFRAGVSVGMFTEGYILKHQS